MTHPDRTAPHPVVRALLVLLGVALVGALAGLVVGVVTPAHVDIAGSDTRIWLQLGRDYDQFGVDNVLTGKRATTRAVLGEPIGVRASLDLDASVLTDARGQFNVDILPAYIQAYSDPDQLLGEVRSAVLRHFVVSGAVGAGLAVLVLLVWRGYRRWRERYDLRHRGVGLTRPAALAYRAPERAFARRLAAVLVALVLIAAVPSSGRRPAHRATITGDAIFAGTPLAGVQVQGLLRPALVAVQSYIETYFEQTNDYYDEVQKRLERYLVANPVVLPGTGDGRDTDQTVQVGFVTDRHCNIGMDRVIVALLKHFTVKTLVSAGDDAFSGSFGFESACTRNLADKTARADIADVFVGGNHDSPTTLAAEAKQGITTLDGDVVEIGGLRFAGSPDPRTSRYGQGIVPSSQSAQDALLVEQGSAVGKAACASDRPIIAVLHDPLAGTTALQNGCGHLTLALVGHTHKQAGPTALPLPDGTTGYEFTGASAGGAPTESAVEGSFASRLTVGPLNHDASITIVSVDRASGALRGVTEFHVTPAQTITVTQQLVG